MPKLRRTSHSVQSNLKSFANEADEQVTMLHSAANRHSTPKVCFLLKLEHDVHDLLKGIADAEDRSMQWLLRKMTSEVIRKKAQELGIVS